MRKTNISRKNHRIDVRLTTAEYAKIENQFKTSTCRNKAQYVRELIFHRPIRISHRNESLDDLMEEIVILNREINSLKDALSKTLEKLYRDKDSLGIQQSLLQTQLMVTSLLKKMDEVKTQMEKITEKWLQS